MRQDLIRTADNDWSYRAAGRPRSQHCPRLEGGKPGGLCTGALDKQDYRAPRWHRLYLSFDSLERFFSALPVDFDQPSTDKATAQKKRLTKFTLGTESYPFFLGDSIEKRKAIEVAAVVHRDNAGAVSSENITRGIADLNPDVQKPEKHRARA